VVWVWRLRRAIRRKALASSSSRRARSVQSSYWSAVQPSRSVASAIAVTETSSDSSPTACGTSGFSAPAAASFPMTHRIPSSCRRSPSAYTPASVSSTAAPERTAAMMSPHRSYSARFCATVSVRISTGSVASAIRAAYSPTRPSSSITSLSDLAMAALLPNALYTVATATPASAAMASTVVPAYPDTTNSRRAARTICRRVSAACCCRHVATPIDSTGLLGRVLLY
jgi:hypothetical protein